jgi:predicted acyltransferase (DUF342 family)
MFFWAPFALVTVTAALLVLPVTPALMELRKRRDATPLPTGRDDGKVTHFADSFRARLEPLRPALHQCHSRRENSRVQADGMEVLLVGGDGFDFDRSLLQNVDVVMCSVPAFIPAGRVIEADVYAEGTLDVAEGVALRAALALGDIIIEQNSHVLRWLHARGSVYIRRGSSAQSRVSADQSIFLERGSAFQRIHAPLIFTMDTDEEDRPLPHEGGEFIPMSARHRKIGTEAQPGPDSELFAARPRMRVQGDFVLPAGESLKANVICTGKLHLERGSRFFGNAKSYGNTVIEDDACMHGSLACGDTAYLGPRSFVAGPIMAEQEVFMAGGARAGQPGRLTTIAACKAAIAPGCSIHGTLWARVQGIVEG